MRQALFALMAAPALVAVTAFNLTVVLRGVIEVVAYAIRVELAVAAGGHPGLVGERMIIDNGRKRYEQRYGEGNG